MTGERFECIACGGQYTCPAANGSLYFHVCPPAPANSKLKPATDAMRNENPPANDRAGRVITAPGKGVKCLSDRKLTEPRWITERRKQLHPEGVEDDD